MTGSGKLLGAVFDLDDTLYLERDYIRSGYGAVAKHLRRSRRRSEDFEDWLWQRFCAGRSQGAFNALSEQFSLGLTPDDIAGLVAVYRGHTPAIAPLPGVHEMLDSLTGRVKLGLLSDGYLPAQPLKLEALGLGDYFDPTIFTEALGRDAWKPATIGFEHIQEAWSLPPETIIYVADNVAKDFIAPKSMGWRTCRIALPGQIHSRHLPAETAEATSVCGSVDELTTCLSAAV